MLGFDRWPTPQEWEVLLSKGQDKKMNAKWFIRQARRNAKQYRMLRDAIAQRESICQESSLSSRVRS